MSATAIGRYIVLFYLLNICNKLLSKGVRINQSINFQSGLSSEAAARTTMGVTVKQCYIIVSYYKNTSLRNLCLS